MRDAPVLVPDQRVEPPPALQVTCLAVESVHRRLDSNGDFSIAFGYLRELGLKVQSAAGDLRAPVPNVSEVVAQTLQLRMSVSKDALVMNRSYRQLMAVIRPHCQRPGQRVEFEPQRAGLKHLAVLVAEEGN